MHTNRTAVLAIYDAEFRGFEGSKIPLFSDVWHLIESICYRIVLQGKIGDSMGRIREKQRWQCNVCGTVTLEPDLLTAPSPFADTYELTACPHCKQCDEGFDLLCDEPGCNSHAGCGWPTGNDSDQWGGYRNTCGKHMVPDA